ncbi:L-rhamnose mutarotase [Shivajiella indica]|uniref:L-rhamnose mutarotase n=1 Tax=Shivajiella indica TaxID=872115 RepID=A0ABW5B7D3_9BACT
MATKRYCLTLNLKNDPVLIEEYERYHKQIPEAILQSFKDADILSMELYRWETRLFMVLDVSENFSFERKKLLDENNPKVKEWENLMLKYQEPIAENKSSEKWVLMNQIFKTN